MAVQTKKNAGFFKSIKMELKKVNWPSRKDVTQYTGVVFAMCVAIGAMIAVCDVVFNKMFNFIL